MQYFEDRNRHYSTFSGENLVHTLNLQEYVNVEDAKRELFTTRIDFICMAKSLRIVMTRDSGYKQLKRYLTWECGMNDADAKYNADKYNEGSRIYDKFPLIVENCAKCPDIDIRDFTVKELALAARLSWVIRRAALVKVPKRQVAAVNVQVQVDCTSVQKSVDQLVKSNWYAAAKDNPNLVANIMNQISERVVSKSQYSSQCQ